MRHATSVSAAVLMLCTLIAPASAQTRAAKAGGVLEPVLREDLPHACGSPRNYGGYCNEQIMGLIDKQSQETDPQKRLSMVLDIQKKLEADAARPIMGWRVDRFAHQPYVKTLVPHSVVYNCCRLQDTWLDR